MNIGIIGSGRIGGTLGKHWTRHGHAVLFSSRRPESLEPLVREAGGQARAGTIAEAAAFGEAVLFAPPYWQTDAALEAAGPLDGKILIDATNPYQQNGKPEPPSVVGALVLAKKAPGARLVKGYDMIRAGYLAEEASRPEPDRLAVYYCGDDAEAKRVVAGLIADSGFAGIDAGPLAHAYLMEPHGPLYDQKLTRDEAQRLLASVLPL